MLATSLQILPASIVADPFTVKYQPRPTLSGRVVLLHGEQPLLVPPSWESDELFSEYLQQFPTLATGHN